jgi:hypothetical protein
MNIIYCHCSERVHRCERQFVWFSNGACLTLPFCVMQFVCLVMRQGYSCSVMGWSLGEVPLHLCPVYFLGNLVCDARNRIKAVYLLMDNDVIAWGAGGMQQYPGLECHFLAMCQWSAQCVCVYSGSASKLTMQKASAFQIHGKARSIMK